MFITTLFVLSCGQTNQGKKVKQKRIATQVDTTKSKSPSQKEYHFSEEDALQKKSIDHQTQIANYQIDKSRSIVYWHCVTHTGYIKFKNGQVDIANGEIVNAQFNVEMDSIRDTDIDYSLMKDVLTNTLKSADFFDVKKYPTSSFTLTHIKKDKGSFYLAKGILKIKDINKAIQFRSSISINDSSIMLVSERFPINRTQWGITIYSKNYEQTDDSFLFTDFVELQISLYLTR